MSVKEYNLDAKLWYKESTDEWVLEVSGGLDDTHVTIRTTAPGFMKPEDAIYYIKENHQ